MSEWECGKVSYLTWGLSLEVHGEIDMDVSWGKCHQCGFLSRPLRSHDPRAFLFPSLFRNAL